VGLKVLERYQLRRNMPKPLLIYLDSAHEEVETFLEMSLAWRLLPDNGILMGDDWGWAAVSNDVSPGTSLHQVNQGLGSLQCMPRLCTVGALLYCRCDALPS
jgi:hypothetical protein